VRKGGLKQRYDVIIVPSQGRSARQLVFDIPMRGKPLPYTKTAQSRFLGDYGSSPDIRGGMGLEGLQELRHFVEEGGTLITLGDSSAMPPEYGLAPDVEGARTSKDFYAPGPIVNARVTAPANPIFYGYTETTIPVRWASTNTLYSLPERARGLVLMDFPGGAANVLSGLMTTPDEIKNRPALITEPLGKGRVLMFRMLYNALLNYRQLDLGLPAAAGK
jgi:hypothetical protein